MPRPLALAACIALSLAGGAEAGPQGFGSSTGPQTTTNAEIVQTMAGRGWSTSTGNVTIASGKVLDLVLSNAAGSGCNGVITLRRYSNYSTSQLAFTTYGNPGVLVGATAATVNTRQAGTAPITGLSMAFVVQNAGLMTGTVGVTDGLLATAKEEIVVPYSVPAGKAIGLELSGLTGLLTGAVVVSMTFGGYCS